jgi:hypothetical protein
MNDSNFLYHYRGACFKPYKLFFNLHTWCSLPLTMNLSGCSMYCSSSRSPCKNDELFNFQVHGGSNAKHNSDQRHLDHWREYFIEVYALLLLKPFTTNLALYLGCEVCSSVFTLTHILECFLALWQRN